MTHLYCMPIPAPGAKQAIPLPGRQLQAGGLVGLIASVTQRSYREIIEQTDDCWTIPTIMEELKAKAQEAGRWNLFLPDKEYGYGLNNLEYGLVIQVGYIHQQIMPGPGLSLHIFKGAGVTCVANSQANNR